MLRRSFYVQLNLLNICLIPKVKKPSGMMKLRPINFYKGKQVPTIFSLGFFFSLSSVEDSVLSGNFFGLSERSHPPLFLLIELISRTSFDLELYQRYPISLLCDSGRYLHKQISMETRVSGRYSVSSVDLLCLRTTERGRSPPSRSSGAKISCRVLQRISLTT